MLVEDAEHRVWLTRECPAHGRVETLYQEDAGILRYLERWEAPPAKVTPDDPGNLAPVPGCYLAGLGGRQTQHTCILLEDVTGSCDLRCPTCFVDAGPEPASFVAAGDVLANVDRRLAREGGKLDVVMVSGGEPTLHPHLEELLDALAARPVVRVLLNTNGLRLAHDDGLLRFLAARRDRIEIYLQFDGFRAATWRHHRGADLRLRKDEIVERLSRAGVFTTLVMCASKGVNDDEIGDVVRVAFDTPFVAGVCVQPQFGSGRSAAIDPSDRLTHTGVLARLAPQTSGLVGWNDMIGLPCSHPHCASVGYFVRDDSGAWRSLVEILGQDPLAERLDLVQDRIADWQPRRAVRTLAKDSVMGLLSERNAMSHPATVRLLLRLVLGSGIGAIGLARLFADRTPSGRRRAGLWVAGNVKRVTVKPFMDLDTMIEERLLRCCIHVGAEGESGMQAVPFCAAQAWPALSATSLAARAAVPVGAALAGRVAEI
jgi:uncharacterized radical SAM superfamily Fe-S cluster-containing enzyme